MSVLLGAIINMCLSQVKLGPSDCPQRIMKCVEVNRPRSLYSDITVADWCYLHTYIFEHDECDINLVPLMKARKNFSNDNNKK
jgi:hypothetical protein